MQHSDISADADLDAQARAWIVRLRSGSATQQDLERLALWRAGSPATEAAFDRARRLWAALEPALHSDADKRVTPLRRTMSRRSMIGGGMAIAASAAGVAWIGGVRPMLADGSGELVATAKGERRQLVLASGARLDLNTASRVRLPEEGGGGAVELLRGEALLTVAAASVTVLARLADAAVAAQTAQLLLRREANAATVTCLSGEAWVEHAERRFSLGPRDELVLDVAARTARLDRAPAPAQRASWRTGQLIYEDRRLGDVVEELNRYRPGRIIVRGEGLAERRVTGVVQLDRIDGALTNFARSLGAPMTRLPGGIVILG